MPLFDYFLNVPVLEHLWVVVQVSSDNRSMNPPPQVKQVIEGEDPIKVARDTFLANLDDYFKKKKSHSRSKRSHSLSNSSSFRERQRDEKLQIACGHPRDLEESIPVTLLHPVFGQFIDNCRTHMITEEDNNLVYELANVMSALYETENKRVDAVSDVLSGHHLNFRLHSEVQGAGYVTDADMSVDVHNNRHPYVIAEFKNEAGSEPYAQAIVDYLESTRMFASKMSGSALPCFLFILFGPYIVFAGAVWTLRPAIQILSSPLVFNYHSTDTHNQIAAARHMAAFPLDDSSETCFKYTGQLDEDEGASKRLIFFGTLIDGPVEDAICIKFVRHYSREVHLRCASSQLAPDYEDLKSFLEVGTWWSWISLSLRCIGRLAQHRAPPPIGVRANPGAAEETPC
ncbi:hypothetical protein BDR07DRAFT_1460627 [Suillus spraguei]|nr:hypothetical protein BDR07DRAFT_1460627 [Suillus spraguei]